MLNELYYQMLRIRMIEEAIVEHYPHQKMRCPVHLSIGQEAVASGVSYHLKKEDLVVSGHRAHAHYLAKGGSLKKMMAEIYGKATGCCLGRGGSMHLTDRAEGFLCSTPIVGGSIPVGVGAAWALQLKGKFRLTVIYLGEGATEEGVFAESLNFASLKQLPILFVCENNLYSVYSPLEVRQSKNRDLLKMAEAHGVVADKGDGNDVLEVASITEKAIKTIGEGRGPVFLEFSTYRHREHCGPNFDNHIGYRTEDEFLHFLKDCPLKKYRHQIRVHEEMERKIRQEIDEAFLFAEKSPFPIFDPAKETLYAEIV
ncbi:MAG: thiamine pyrophosphate-dependent dehydrogenase E1 component subunit alpha [Simkaniaceae bacterium]|nr:thiamine pyrophosphate-dependent dehydrogenase E1 component subunit alpha [Simkaniaceae bacterium]